MLRKEDLTVSHQLAGLSLGCEEGEAVKVLMGSGSTLAGNDCRRQLPFSCIRFNTDKRGWEEEARLTYGFRRNLLNFQSKSFEISVFPRAFCRAFLNSASTGPWGCWFSSQCQVEMPSWDYAYSYRLMISGHETRYCGMPLAPLLGAQVMSCCFIVTKSLELRGELFCHQIRPWSEMRVCILPPCLTCQL